MNLGITENKIGTDAAGLNAIPNSGNGILANAGTAFPYKQSPRESVISNNLIAYNQGAGIASVVRFAALTSNQLFGNAGLGIDNGNDGPTPNSLDNPRNSPVLSSAMITADGSLVVTGTVRFQAVPNPWEFGSKPGQFIELFTTTEAGEARNSLYRFAVVPDSTGAFTASFPAQMVPGQQITATSTRDVSWNYNYIYGLLHDQYVDSTSELSAPIRVEPGLTVSNAQVAEGNSGTGQLLFYVSLGAAADQPVTVDFTTAGGTATPGVDYVLNSGTLTFAPGERSKTVTVEVLGDLDIELNEFLEVTLTNASGAPIADTTGRGFVMNDDAPTVPTFRIADAAPVVERDTHPNGGIPLPGDLTPAVFTITLDSPQPVATTVRFTTANGTAVGGDPAPSGISYYPIYEGPDFWTASGMLTFLPGETSKTITALVVGGLAGEDDETFSVVLSNPSSGVGIARGTGVGTIWDDDAVLTVSDTMAEEGAAAAFTLTLAKALAHPVTLKYATVDGSATAGADYAAVAGSFTIAAGVTVTTISVPTLKDGIAELAEKFQLRVSEVVGARFAGGEYAPLSISKTATLNEGVNVLNISDATVVEGPAGSTNTALFQVTLDAPSAIPVQVSYASAPVSALSSQDYSPLSSVLTFAPGETAKTIAISILGDALVEADETFKVILSNASIGGRIGDGEGLGTIVDDEPPTLSIADAAMQEGAAGETRAMTFTASLNAPARGPISVHWATADGSSVGGVDYAVTSGELVFAAGEQTKQFTVEVLGDDTTEADERFLVRLSSANGATLLDGEAIGTILTDELALSIQDVSVREGQTARFAVSLSYAVDFPVSVDFSTADGTAVAGHDYISQTRTLVFAPGETQQFVDVELTDDNAPEGDETFRAMLSNPEGVVIADDEAAGVILNDDRFLLVSDNRRSATWRDIDGDLVTLRSNRPSLDVADFAFSASGPFGAVSLEQLHLDAAGAAAPNGTTLTFSVQRDAAFPGGNGTVDVGWINAERTRLGAVTVPGNLGAISAGYGGYNGPVTRGNGLSRLTVGSLGYPDSVGATSDTPTASFIAGNVGPVVVHGSIHNAAIHVFGSIASLTVGGSISSGDKSLQRDVTQPWPASRDQGVFVTGVIGRIDIEGSIVGDLEHPVLFAAAGMDRKFKATTKTVIRSMHVGGDVSFGTILGGFYEAGPANEKASLGKIVVDGNWNASSIVAGASAGEDRMFGTLDDTLINSWTLPRRSSVAKIAQIVIGGTTSGTEPGVSSTDSFGFVAGRIGALKIDGATIPLFGSRVDAMPLGLTEDFRLQELRGVRL